MTDSSAASAGADPAPLPGSLRQRFDQPLERATAITRRTLEWFPIRVWRHFLQHNGFLLAAGISYQSLFAIFGVIYLAFAAVGAWLGGSSDAIRALIDIINGYIPDLISDSGLVKPEQVRSVATGSTGLLTVTGAVAAVVVVWTAIGFVTYTRRAVRDTFGLPFDRRNYLLLKARDFLAATLFGLALLLGAGLGSITTGAVDLLFQLVGWDDYGAWSAVLTRAVSLVVAFGLNTLALASLFRFLTGASLRWQRIWPGALLGAAAIVVLQLGAGLLLVYTPANPLLATFAVFIGFLLWFRLNGIVLLVSAAWIAVAAADRFESIESEADARATERAALVIAARVRVREAERAAADAPWYARRAARRRVAQAEAELREAERNAPAVPDSALPWD
ncbi:MULTISPECIES: YihY/virulence factor BrkB family protein [Microbacterium]|uniref:YihY/virulence factor BrkB family protein n=1 Tax=Microbacterium wangchenii TaxID=2541726 RepID=A0ABX5SS55_9MICO|nr:MULTISPECIES: YihY/virulence factor BrkB family protein [Microbacterium]MCK6066715.1 YihY/virulence factor BrkB family protein [Microbacterium sp. EYE_512]QBR88041.1 YihY/virulence factor BrkB family protein [Microbacterium wangchenii]TFV83842.1 YihY/virulence factor BrkB family protein [Microbacterium sp. dk485]TXK18169.1 YihY/virulence factor BrkB family protein [Microbacterium wangchenii]